MGELDHTSTEQLREELEQFRKEKEKIRTVIGQVGGRGEAKRETVVTVCFIVVLIVLFVLDALRALLHVHLPFPELFSIEIGILLVSIKIIWMIRKQTKVEHFQFWILNSIEFRLNELSKQLKRLEKAVPAGPETKGTK